MADAQAYREAASSRGRVVFVLWAQYMADLAAPEAQWIKPEFANGERNAVVVVFADGHVELVSKANAAQLRWTP